MADLLRTSGRLILASIDSNKPDCRCHWRSRASLQVDEGPKRKLPADGHKRCKLRARQDFVQRPKRLVEDEDCLSCRYLSICHGGCPVRTYSALGTMMAKDPYCEVYKAVFACAENHGREILPGRRANAA